MPKVRTCTSVFLILALMLMLAGIATAAVNGAIQTTTSDGKVVNANIYPSKDAVYLTGGPQNEHDPGLVPDGTYYFQVTDPNGATLLSTDAISCRRVVVQNGRIIGVPSDSGTPPTGTVSGCDHQLGTFNASNGEVPVQLIPYNDTPNPGGEYKAWLTPVANYSPDSKNNCSSTNSNITFGFCDSDSKTDNFKIKTPVAHVTVCKFDDQNDNSTLDPGEPLLAHWPITATGVDNGSVTNTTVNTQTGDSGCVTFAVTTFSNPDGTQTVTLKEGTFGPDWKQTAPVDGPCTLTGTAAAGDTCNVSSGVITLTLTIGDNANAPNFGNFNPNCDNECAGGGLVVSKTARPAFTRTFTWGITKNADQSTIDTSSSATFNYTVSVTHDSGTDSGWQVTGSIKMSNPTGSDISGVDVTDAVDDGGSCTVDTSSFNGTVPAGSHVDLPYVCTYSSSPSPAAGTNTATATWNSGGNTGTGSAGFDFSTATPSIVDGSVTVTDTLGGTFGPVSYADSSPTLFTYSKTFTGQAGTCTSQGNTAKFTTNTTSTTGSASKQVTVCEGADLKVSKTATPNYNSAITKSVDKPEIDTSSGSSAIFNYTVTVTTSGWAVMGNITVANPNDWEDVTVNLTDTLSDIGGSCSITGGNTQTVLRGGSISPAYTCTFAAAPVANSGTNTATASWNAATAFTPDSSASGVASYAFSPLTVTDTFDHATNTLGTISIPPGSNTFTYPRTVTAPVGTCATYNNTAQITGGPSSSPVTVKVCGAIPLTVNKTASASFGGTVKKSVDHTEIDTYSGGSATFNYTATVTTSGWTVNGNITVTNPNDWESVAVNLADALGDTTGVCRITDGSLTVAASSTGSATYTCTFASAPTTVNGTNTATATWDSGAAHTAVGSAQGSASYVFAPITVTDTYAGTLGTVNATQATATFTYPRTVTAPSGTCTTLNNTASIPGTSASQAAKVCGASPLTVSKTAVPTYTPGITKKTNQTSPDEVSGSTTLTYTITATETGWNVSGVITVANPNDWEAIPVSLTDALNDAKGSCTIAGGTSQTVPASSSITPNYSCSFSGAPASTGSNTATVNWNSATAHTLLSSASVAVNYAFAPLTVTDTFNSGTSKTLGSNLVPAASYTFTDSYAVNETGGTCVTYPNVASITGGPSANASATVCNTKTGALTMGFWQNKNGQGIITGGASTNGFCNSGTWLQQYAPFEDLSATASCGQVATYVYNLIKAANASGASMNAMLKAQMLATALDVYFSTPGLGGNLIGTPTPLGGVNINLTQVCNMLAGANGGATCSGSNENTSAAFGGATSGAVSSLLSYAASQSNASGSTWYGQNKTIQGLAKDMFDAINNQAAFIAP